MKRKRIERGLEAYFASLGSSTWGRQFDISDPRRKAEAIRYLADMFEKVQELGKPELQTTDELVR